MKSLQTLRKHTKIYLIIVIISLILIAGVGLLAAFSGGMYWDNSIIKYFVSAVGALLPLLILAILIVIPMIIHNLWQINILGKNKDAIPEPAGRLLVRTTSLVIFAIGVLNIWITVSVIRSMYAHVGGAGDMFIITIPLALFTTCVITVLILIGRSIDPKWKTPFWVVFSILAGVCCLLQFAVNAFGMLI
jgi:hypothetical protein